MGNPLRAIDAAGGLRHVDEAAAGAEGVLRQTGLPGEAADEIGPVLDDAAQQLDTPGGAPRGGPDPVKLGLDLTQIALDIVGIFEPTPFADGANTVISIARGDAFGAITSAAGMLPYLGDAAKLGKFGRWAKTVAEAVDLAASNPALRRALGPALRQIDDALKAIPEGAFKALPESAQSSISAMRSKLDDLFGAGARQVDEAAAQADLLPPQSTRAQLNGTTSPGGITAGMDYSEEAIGKFDFGAHLKKIDGDPPDGMYDPHAHHILFKKGRGAAQQELVQEGQDILRKYDIDPIYGSENLFWAPNRVKGQHSLDALEPLVDRLKELDASGLADRDDMVELLQEFADIAAARR